MEKIEFVRARQSNQIEIRRQEIIKATSMLYLNHSIDDINIKLIAQKSGFTRSNIYRYFKTKEEIFLNILADDHQNWVTLVRNEFNKELSVEKFARNWTELLLKQDRLLGLFSILSTKLEPSSSLENLIDFKSSLAMYSQSLVHSIRLSLPKLSEDDANLFLMFAANLFIGTYPNMNLSKKQQTAMKKSQMPYQPEPYREMVRRAVEVFVKDLNN